MVMEEYTDDQDDEQKEKTAENINEGIIHKDITDNEKTNWYIFKKVIEECPYYTTPAEM